MSDPVARLNAALLLLAALVFTVCGDTGTCSGPLCDSGASFVIDTTGGWNGVESLQAFGDGGAFEVFGQTFVVLAHAAPLQRLSFWLQHSPDDTSGQDLIFRVVVMAWNIDRATGPVLYEDEMHVRGDTQPRDYANITTAESTMTEYLVDTGGLMLVPGQEYVAFLSANNVLWDATSTLIRVGWQNADTYSKLMNGLCA